MVKRSKYSAKTLRFTVVNHSKFTVVNHSKFLAGIEWSNGTECYSMVINGIPLALFCKRLLAFRKEPTDCCH